MAAELSYAAVEVRRQDHERFLTALFAPPEHREALFALYAFNLEVAKTAEVVSEPMIGQIRLQWWRETLAGIYEQNRARRHQVAEPLAEAIAGAGLGRDHFERLLRASRTSIRTRRTPWPNSRPMPRPPPAACQCSRWKRWAARRWPLPAGWSAPPGA